MADSPERGCRRASGSARLTTKPVAPGRQSSFCYLDLYLADTTEWGRIPAVPRSRDAATVCSVSQRDWSSDRHDKIFQGCSGCFAGAGRGIWRHTEAAQGHKASGFAALRGRHKAPFSPIQNGVNALLRAACTCEVSGFAPCTDPQIAQSLGCANICGFYIWRHAGWRRSPGQARRGGCSGPV